MTSEFLRLWESEKESSGLAIFPLHVIIPAVAEREREGGRQQNDEFGSKEGRGGGNDAIAVASMRRASSHFLKPNRREGKSGTERGKKGDGELRNERNTKMATGATAHAVCELAATLALTSQCSAA